MDVTTMKRNARFWVWVHQGWVKITLKPDQELTHLEFGPNEEAAGCWTDAITWRHERDRVVRENTSSSCDCDGPLDRYYNDECLLEDLKAIDQHEVYADPNNVGIFRPDWQKVGY